jgi:bacterioferritin-associated ferredoxin/NifU-like protein involved in Fe-S cluster formation
MVRPFVDHLNHPHQSQDLPHQGWVRTWANENESLGISLLVDHNQTITRFIFNQKGKTVPIYTLSFLTEYLPGKSMEVLRDINLDVMEDFWGDDLRYQEIKEEVFWSPVVELIHSLSREFSGEILPSLPVSNLACRCFHVTVTELKDLAYKHQSTNLSDLSQFRSLGVGCTSCVPNLEKMLSEIKLPQQKSTSKILCRCHRVTEADILTVMNKEPTISFSSLVQKTMASTGCGSCAGDLSSFYTKNKPQVAKRVFKGKSHADWVLEIEKELMFLWQDEAFAHLPAPRLLAFSQGVIQLEVPELRGDMEIEYTRGLLGRLKQDLDQDLSIDFVTK